MADAIPVNSTPEIVVAPVLVPEVTQAVTDAALQKTGNYVAPDLVDPEGPIKDKALKALADADRKAGFTVTVISPNAIRTDY